MADPRFDKNLPIRAQRIIARYAVTNQANGRPMRCGRISHGNSKIVYDDVESARTVARKLHAMGLVNQRVYPCPRAPHFHLTTHNAESTKDTEAKG